MLIKNKTERDNYLRTKPVFYQRGWYAFINNDTLSLAPENAADKKAYEEYMEGFGDAFANHECLTN
jgi:hypothetical protein